MFYCNLKATSATWAVKHPRSVYIQTSIIYLMKKLHLRKAKVETYASVWDALADTPEQAANLRARAELMQQIAAAVKDKDWTQAEAAKRCGVTQPRINDLLRGKVSRFSLDALVNIATAIGRRVHVELEAA